MSNIQAEAVTFDLWQTLIQDNRDLRRTRTMRRLEEAQVILNEAGYSYSLDLLQEAYRRCFRKCNEIHAIEKDVTFTKQVEMFIHEIDEGLHESLDERYQKQILDCYAEAFFDFPAPPDPSAYNTIRKVAQMGYRIGLISNTGQTPGYLFRIYLKQLDMLKFFDVLTFSDEVELTKPSVEIFKMTLKSLGTTPEKSIHVGDHLKNDVIGANLAGMVTVHLVPKAEAPPPHHGTAVPNEQTSTKSSADALNEKEESAKPDIEIEKLYDLPHILGR